MTGILSGFVGATYSTKPGTPTSVSASATAYNSASVSFTAPFNGGLPIDSYVATSCPGGITGSSASSPVSVSGLTGSTSYTFKVKAHNSLGYGCCSSSSSSITTPAPPVSAQIFVVAGGGQGGSRAGGGAGGITCGTYNLTRGSTYSISVGAGAPTSTYDGTNQNGCNSSFSGPGASLTAYGGGHGAFKSSSAASGGSGGGGNAQHNTGASGSQGGQGGDISVGSCSVPVAGASGGGAGGRGYGSAQSGNPSWGNQGGPGRAFSVTGTTYGGGGGGAMCGYGFCSYWNGSSRVLWASYNNNSGSPGGAGGGGSAGWPNGDSGRAGGANTGGGGGGNGCGCIGAIGYAGGGGSGIVLVAAAATPVCYSGGSYLGCYCVKQFS